MASYEHSVCPVHADFDPLSPTFLDEPFARRAGTYRYVVLSVRRIDHLSWRH